MEKTIKITIDTATRWYNGEDQELKELALQAFPELVEQVIKKGTLVWVRDYDDSQWFIRFYSHSGTNFHFTFVDGLKPSEGGETVQWKFCTAKNPFLEDEKSYQLLKKAFKMVKSLHGTISAHPDNVFGSEFHDQSKAAGDLIQEIKKFMEL
jgi:hypothetical protein